MENYENLFKFCDDGKIRYIDQATNETIMTICVDNNDICIYNNTDCNDIEIPVSILCKLIFNSDKEKINNQLRSYLK